MSREMLNINKGQHLAMKYTEAAIFSFYQKFKNNLEYLVEGVQMARWTGISFTFHQKQNFKELICSYFPKPIWTRECWLSRLSPPNYSYLIMKTWFLYRHSWYLTHPNEAYITFKIHGRSLWKPINISSSISVLLTLSPSLPRLLSINGHILHAIWPKSFHIHCARTDLIFFFRKKSNFNDGRFELCLPLQPIFWTAGGNLTIKKHRSHSVIIWSVKHEPPFSLYLGLATLFSKQIF